MKAVLLRSVDNLGQAGQAVDVKRGYFRNFLEPRGMALVATEQNIKMVESKKHKLDALVAREKSDAEQIRSVIDGIRLVFKLRAGDRGQLFGSITSRDVVDAIKSEHNIEIERRKVDMEILKTLGDHHVRVRVYPGVIAHLTAHIERLVAPGEEENADQPAGERIPEAVGTFITPDYDED